MQNIAALRSDKLKKLALRSAVGQTRFTTEERTQTSSCHNTVQWYRRGGSNTVQLYHNGQVRRQHHHQSANPLFHPSPCLWGSWTLSLEAAVVGQFDRTVTSDSEVLILILANLHSAANCATCQLEVTAWWSWQPAVNGRPKLANTCLTHCCVTWSACIL